MLDRVHLPVQTHLSSAIICLQLCERIDSTLDIRHGTHHRCHHQHHHQRHCGNIVDTPVTRAVSIGSERHAYAQSLVALMHKVGATHH